MKKLLSCLSAVLLASASSSVLSSCSVQIGKKHQNQSIPVVVQAQSFAFLANLMQEFNEQQQMFSLQDYFAKYDPNLSAQSLLFYADGLNPQQLDPTSLQGSFNSSTYSLVNRLNTLFNLNMGVQVNFNQDAIKQDAAQIKTIGDLTKTKYLDYGVSNFDQLEKLKLVQAQALVSTAANVNNPDDFTNFFNFINIFSAQRVATINSAADLAAYFQSPAFDYDQATKWFKQKATTIRTLKLTFSVEDHPTKVIPNKNNTLQALIKLDNFSVFGDYWPSFLDQIERQFQEANEEHETNLDWIAAMKFLFNQTDLFNFRTQANFPALVLDGNDFRAYFEDYTKNQKLYTDYLAALNYQADYQVAHQFLNYVRTNHQEQILTTTDWGDFAPVFANAPDYAVSDLRRDVQKKLSQTEITAINDEQGQAYNDQDLLKNQNFVTIKTANHDYRILIFNQLKKNDQFDELKSQDVNALRVFLSGSGAGTDFNWDSLGTNYYVNELTQPYQAKNQPIPKGTVDFTAQQRIIHENLVTKHYEGTKNQLLDPNWWRLTLVSQYHGTKNKKLSFVLK